MNASAARPAGLTIAWRYVGFALIATMANLGTQQIVVGVAPLAASIGAGTLVGFVAKYVLDKNFIFFDAYSGHAREAGKVLLYGLFSIVTTLVFWSFETGFWVIWHSDFAKYSGALLGLALGYAAKFLLDQRFTFRPVAA
jgi:putative flippase GtrA